MSVLSTSPEFDLDRRTAGQAIATGIAWVLVAVGWAAAKAVRLAGWALSSLLYGAGWLASAVAWPGLCWCGRAVALGWQEGRRPIGGRRGDS